MSANAVKAGQVYIELSTNDSKLKAGLDRATSKMKSWGESLNKIGSNLTLAGGGMLAPMTYAVKAASDLNETMSKFGAVFGDQAKGVEAWMDNFTGAVGRSKKEVADGLSSFQAFFSGMGVGKEEAAGFSKEMTGLAVDFGSFHNVQDPEAMQRFISALSGSGEVLSMYGVNLMSAALDQELLAQGFSTVAGGATEVQKVMARMSIIKEAMGSQGAVGDAIRTAAGFANQLKAAKGELIDMAGKLGGMLIPVFQQWLASAREITGVVAKWVGENPELVVGLAKVAGELLAAGVAMKALGTAFAIVKPLLLAAFTPLGALAVAAVGIVTLASAFGLLGSSVAETSNEMQSLADKHAQLRSDDQVRMQRLEQLAEAEALNNDEMEEAESLISQLEGRYGDLGISLDKTTGKINGMSDAQKKLNEAMKKQEIADVEKQVTEAGRNVEALKEERSSWSAGGWNNTFSAQGTVDKNRDRIREDLQNEVARQTALKERLAALQGGNDVKEKEGIDKTKAKVSGKKDDAGKAIEKGEQANKDIEKMDEDRRRKSLEGLQLELDDIRKAGEERKKLIADVIAGEKARKGGGRQEVLDELDGRLAGVDSFTEQELNEARGKDAKKKADEDKKTADDKAKETRDRKQGLQDDLDRQAVELKFADPGGLADDEKKQLEREKENALRELERTTKLRDARAEGADEDELSMINRQFDGERRLAEAARVAEDGDEQAQNKIESIGTFSAAAVQGMGVSSINEKIARASEETAKNTKRLVDNDRDRKGVVFK